MFSNLDNHSNSCFIYFLADAVPEGIEQTGYLLEFTEALDIDSENDWSNALKLYRLQNNVQ